MKRRRNDTLSTPLAVAREVEGELVLDIVATPAELDTLRERAARHPAFAGWLGRVMQSAGGTPSTPTEREPAA